MESIVGTAAVLGTAAITAPLARAAEKSLESINERWSKGITFTLQVADAMPAESYDFKPMPEMRGYGELMRHIGDANMFYIGRLSKTPPPAALKPAKAFDKESSKKYLAATFDYCGELLKGATLADLDEVYRGRPNTPAYSGWDLVLNGFIHTAHHRGYADVYLRLKGITPPTYNV